VSLPRERALLRSLCLALTLLFVSHAASAHLLNMTRIEVQLEPSGRISMHMQIDLSRAAGGALEYHALSLVEQPLADPRFVRIQRRLEQAIDIRWGAERVPFRVVSVELPKLPKEQFVNPLNWPMTRIELVGTLPQAGSAEMHGVMLTSFPFEEPISLTFTSTAEKRSMTRWLVAGQISPTFAGEAAAPSQKVDGSSLVDYLKFGFLHILPKGLDHVLFVLGLYLGARSLRSLLILVTSFTLAHSITLGLAALGVFRLPSSIVEPLIAASIVWVAVENLFPRFSRGRPVIVFGFGLLHGLGFASALAALHLPSQNFLLTLLTFNAGIELGQLTVIALAFAITGWFLGKPWYRARLAVPASLLIATLAAYWTVERIL
jgi:hypothetical protein